MVLYVSLAIFRRQITLEEHDSNDCLPKGVPKANSTVFIVFYFTVEICRPIKQTL